MLRKTSLSETTRRRGPQRDRGGAVREPRGRLRDSSRRRAEQCKRRACGQPTPPTRSAQAPADVLRGENQSPEPPARRVLPITLLIRPRQESLFAPPAVRA